MGYLWSTFHKTLPDGGVAYGSEKQDTSTVTAITIQCRNFLRKNLHIGTAYGYEYSFNQPSSYKYSPSQWLWGKTFSKVCLLGERADQSRFWCTPDCLDSVRGH